MKLELYSLNNDIHSQKIKEFLIKNNIKLMIKDLNNNREEIKKLSDYLADSKESLLKITKSHSISIINGYNELSLNQLLEHIKKYSPKLQ